MKTLAANQNKKFHPKDRGALGYTHRGKKYKGTKNIQGAYVIAVIGISEDAQIIATSRSWISARNIDQRTWWDWLKSAKLIPNTPRKSRRRKRASGPAPSPPP